MTARRARIAALALATAFPALALAAPGAAPTVVLNLQGGFGNETAVACKVTHHYTDYRIGQRFVMDGSVQPSPGASRWRVKVKVKRCTTTGRFRRVWSGHALGKPDGTFKISYRPRRRGSYFARAYYYGVRPAARSDKQYFRVR